MRARRELGRPSPGGYMLKPLQCTFRGMPPSAALEAHVRKQAAKLDRFFGRIMHCHVVIDASHRHHRHGKRYRVSIDMAVPHHEVAVARNPPQSRVIEDAYAAVDAAFHDAERRLDELAQRMRGYMKARGRERTPTARVTKIFADRGFGFLENEDGEEVYFHKNSVLRQAFRLLAPGTLVRYYEEAGEQGPQASTVEVVT
jgi:ribosomal subunit interface protein